MENENNPKNNQASQDENSTYLKQDAESRRIVKRVSLTTLIWNIILTAAKLTVGAFFFNLSVLSDAAHSFSDVATTVLVLLAVVISKPVADREHNYGHEKRESLAALILGFVLVAVGILFTVQSIRNLIVPSEVDTSGSRFYFLIGITVFSILVKEAMYWYTVFYAKKVRSDMLKADAWHHRSDSLSSVAVLIGLICSIFSGTDLAESIAILAVAALLLWVALGVIRRAVNQLTDKAADEKTRAAILEIVSGVDHVSSVDKLQTRMFGSAFYVDVEIGVKADLSVTESHAIAEKVHEKLESQTLYSIKHVNVHVNPSEAKEETENSLNAEETPTAEEPQKS